MTRREMIEELDKLHRAAVKAHRKGNRRKMWEHIDRYQELKVVLNNGGNA